MVATGTNVNGVACRQALTFGATDDCDFADIGPQRNVGFDDVAAAKHFTSAGQGRRVTLIDALFRFGRRADDKHRQVTQDGAQWLYAHCFINVGFLWVFTPHIAGQMAGNSHAVGHYSDWYLVRASRRHFNDLLLYGISMK